MSRQPAPRYPSSGSGTQRSATSAGAASARPQAAAPAGAPAVPVAPVFRHTNYVVRRKVLKLFGGAFHVYDSSEQVIAYSKMKAFKLKEDIRLYTGEDMSTEILTIKARQVVDISASYDVVDPMRKVKVGVLRRKGLKSMIRDEWAILGPQENEIGMIQEESTMLALVRRFVDMASMLMPQQYDVTMGGMPVAMFKQNFNPFVYKLNVDRSLDANKRFDPRLCLAAAILMAAIEGKQS